MCNRFEEWQNEIKDYCDQNALSFEKAKKMVMCENKDALILQYYDRNSNSKNEIHNETPLPVVLWIFRTVNGLLFEQTENTAKYLLA